MSWTRSARRSDSEAGFGSVEFVIGSLLALLVFVLLVNVAVNQYARGVIRAAADEGVRTGSKEGATALDCEARAAEALGNLLRGSIGRAVTLRCHDDGLTMRAEATATLPGWLPGTPTWNVVVRAASAKELAP